MKKMKILALVMVVAFAAVGGAYALWYDTLLIEETVNTGRVDVNFTEVCGSDWGCNYAVQAGGPGVNVYQGSLDSMDPGNPNESKNIGCKDRTIINNGNTLSMTLTNGYPGYQEFVDATIKNEGTVPVKFMFKLTGDPDGIIHDAVTNPNGWLIVEIKAVGVNGAAIEGYQLDPDKELRIKIKQRVRQIAPQGATTTFEYTIQSVQWNEYDFYPLPDVLTEPRITGPDANPTIKPIPWGVGGFLTTP